MNGGRILLSLALSVFPGFQSSASGVVGDWKEFREGAVSAETASGLPEFHYVELVPRSCYPSI